MTLTLRRFSAFSTAPTPLLASCWKAYVDNPHSSRILSGQSHAAISSTRKAGYSSIADAMLGRAVQSYQAPPPRKETLAIPKAGATKQGSSPAVPKGIDDMLRNGPSNSKKSISGWTNTQSTTSSMGTSVAGSSVFSRANSSAPSKPTMAGTVMPNGLKRTSSEMSGISAALGRQDSFEDKVRGWNSIQSKDTNNWESQILAKTSEVIHHNTDIIDLTQEAPSKSHAPQPVEFDFDPDDFEDDNELDLEMEYPLSLPPMTSMAPPRLPARTPQQLAIPSSAPTWSSSPLAHKATPPGDGIRRPNAQEPEPDIPIVSSEPSIDANPRPAKRRTTPWAQRDAEEREREAHREEEREAGGVQCFRCNEYGHMIANCTKARSKNETNGRADGFTPLPKDKSLPWNTTASAIKDQQKAFKNHQKMVKEKQEKMSMEEMFKPVKHVRKEPSKPTPTFLSAEQRNVLDLVTQRKKSVFFTGSAGTGKSVLMRSIIAELRQIYKKEQDRIAVTASTGLAACNIGGVTLHSFGGIGLGKESVPDLVKKIMRNQKAKNRWLRTKVLIVDEVSMVDGELFDKLEGIARFIRKNGRPFGGIQLVVTGDFFQLPPVPDYGKKVKFAFDADTWSTSIHHTIGLTEVFRQRDPVFANMLNEMRLGKISDATMKAFRRLDRPLEAFGLDATELFPTRNEVDNSNFMKMRQLQGASKIYLAEDGGTVKDQQQLERLLQNFMAPKKLELKKGAQVMLIKNMDDNLVNGSLGKVIGFMNEKTFNMYEANDDLDAATADEGEMDDTFTETKKKLKGMMNKDLVGDTGKEYPLVQFLSADNSSRVLLCQPEDWKIELPNGEIQAQRRQIPLILAWALSIHKAQGQTLERVKVDLRKVFENGQAYVALSRATTQEGLWVQNFNAKAVMAHPRVGEFYNSLYSVNMALKHPKVQAIKTSAKDIKTKIEGNAGPGRLGHDDWDEDEEDAMAAYG